MTLSMPPIRPGRLTRIANRLGVRRTELVTAMWTTVAGAPIAATVVLLATVPVPQPMGQPFDPTPDTIAPSSAAEPTPSPPPVVALTAPRRAPRVIAPTREPERSSTALARFASCTEAAAAGRHDIPRGDPQYRAALDHDDDGTACESAGEPEPSSTAAEPTPERTADPAPTEAPETTRAGGVTVTAVAGIGDGGDVP